MVANKATDAAADLAGSLGPSVEEAAQRIRDLNERLIEAAKNAGNVSLDAYEKALQSLADFEEKIAGASQLEWVNAVASAHSTFISDVSSVYTRAARDMLK